MCFALYQALYRKYRPQTFGEVVGQEPITTTLTGSLKSGRVFHAYLFTGTRGTGKTTCAKILAKAVCCETPVEGQPCGQCAACRAIAEGVTTDISEIDAASNTGVNDIRELKEQVSFLPVSLKYRVYIIDEVHMLSTSAFNALLKTLEEPPAHVIFILATTEVHKLPATILSRCQRFDFKRLEPEVMSARMQQIAAKEGFTLTQGAATMISSLADGGMRDALSLLDQCAVAADTIDESCVMEVCGIAGNERIFELVEAVRDRNPAAAVQAVDTLYRHSVDLKKMLYELVSLFRNLMVIQTVKNPNGLIVCSTHDLERMKQLADEFTLSAVLEALSILQAAAESLGQSASRSEVELTLVRLCTPELSSTAAGLKRRVERLEQTLSALQKGQVFPTFGSPKAASQSALASSEPSFTGQETTAATTLKPVSAEALAEEEIPLPSEENEPPAETISSVQPIAPAKPQEDTRVTSSPKENSVPSGQPVPVTQWPEILALVKRSCPLMVGVLADSKAYIGNGRLLIDSKLSQFKDMINSNAKYRDYIREAAEQVLGTAYPLGPYHPPKSEQKTETKDPLLAFKQSLEQP